MDQTGTDTAYLIDSAFNGNQAFVRTVMGTATSGVGYLGTAYAGAMATVTQTTTASGGGVRTAANAMKVGYAYYDATGGYQGFGSPFSSNSAYVQTVTGEATGYTAQVTQGTYAVGGGVAQGGTASATVVDSDFTGNRAYVQSVQGTANSGVGYFGAPYMNATADVEQTTHAVGGGIHTEAAALRIGAAYYDGLSLMTTGFGSDFSSNQAYVGSVQGTAGGYEAAVTQTTDAFGGGVDQTGTDTAYLIDSAFNGNQAFVRTVMGTATSGVGYLGTAYAGAMATVTQTTTASGGGVRTAANAMKVGYAYYDATGGYQGFGSPFSSNSAYVQTVTGEATGYTAQVTQGTYAVGGGVAQGGTASATVVDSDFTGNRAYVQSVMGTANSGDALGYVAAEAGIVQHNHAFGGGLYTDATTVTIGQRYYDPNLPGLVSFPSAFTNNQAYVSSATGTTTGFGADTRQYTKAGGGGAFLHGDYGPTYIYDGTFDLNQARASNITSSATSANGTAYDKSYTTVVGGGLADLFGYLYVDSTSFTNNQATTDTVDASSTGQYHARTDEGSVTSGGGFYHVDGYVKIIDGYFKDNVAQGSHISAASTAAAYNYGGGKNAYTDQHIAVLGGGFGHGKGDVTVVHTPYNSTYFGYNQASLDDVTGSASGFHDGTLYTFSNVAGGGFGAYAYGNVKVIGGDFYKNSVSQTNTTLYAYGGNSAMTVASLGSYGGAVAQGYGTGTIVDSKFRYNSASNTDATSDVVSSGGNANDILFVSALGGGVFQYDGNLSIDLSYFSYNQVNAGRTSSDVSAETSGNARNATFAGGGGVGLGYGSGNVVSTQFYGNDASAYDASTNATSNSGSATAATFGYAFGGGLMGPRQ